jgi:phage terminase Nu1 subunit (DNA packaging protein)
VYRWGGKKDFNLGNFRMADAPQLMSATDFAAYKGVTKGTVSKWKARGLVILQGRFVDVARTDALVDRLVDATQGRPRAGQAAQVIPMVAEPAAPQGPSVRDELVAEQIVRRRMENERAAGGLVALGEVESRAAESGRRVREGMHAMARMLAERLATMTEPREITALLSEEIDAVCGRLADALEAETAPAEPLPELVEA